VTDRRLTRITASVATAGQGGAQFTGAESGIAIGLHRARLAGDQPPGHRGIGIVLPTDGHQIWLWHKDRDAVTVRGVIR
jgi:hypothetical protein